jgi:hypothetical protein
LEVTLEQGHPSVPVGKVMLQALFPHNPTIHIRHLLFSFDSTPGAIGFMVGVLLQTQVLDLRAQALQKAAAAHDTQMTQCEAQAMVNILEGAQGRNYRALGKQCPTNESVGDGYGVLPGPKEGSGYLSGALEHTSLVTSQPEATSDTRAHAPLAVTALNNVKTWLQIIEQDAVALAKTPADTSKVAEMVTLAAYAYRGVDANHDGKIDPIQGEAGALSAYQQAQLMATLQMTPPKASGG